MITSEQNHSVTGYKLTHAFQSLISSRFSELAVRNRIQPQRFSRAGSRHALTIVGSEPARSATQLSSTASTGSPVAIHSTMLTAAVARQERSSSVKPPSPRLIATSATASEAVA